MQGHSFRRPMNVSSPEELARRRGIARAMMAKNAQIQPKNLWEGLNSLATSIGERNSLDRLNQEEAEGKASAESAYAPIKQALANKQPIDSGTLMGALSNEWSTPGQRSIAQAFMQQQLEQADPMYGLKKRKAELEVDEIEHPRMTPYQQAQIDIDKQKTAAGARSDFGLNPGYGVDENGNIVAFQPNKAGGVPAVSDGSQNAFASDPQFGQVVTGQHEENAELTLDEIEQELRRRGIQ